MYTILVTQDNELRTTVRERIMQRSKNVDALHFLVDPLYKDLDMSEFIVRMEIRHVNMQEPRSELLILSPELYKDKLEYKIPVDTWLTKNAGDVEVQLSFTKLDLDEYGNQIQRVRRTSWTTIPIVPLSAWSNFVTDEALNALDSAFLQLEGYMKHQEEIAAMYQDNKADDMKLDAKTGELYLTSKGDKIGTTIALDDLGNAISEHTEDGLVTMII